MNLCAPTGELSCFACCPPIRPAGYDHLDYRSSVVRELSDNRTRYLREGPQPRPIVGFTCWALGFLDSKGHRAGCLLHPCRNGGEDLRHLVDYGNKCRRESCPPARIFDRMPMEHRPFWLRLVEGFDCFRYSSPRENLLFRILLWDHEVLGHLQSEADAQAWKADDLLTEYPFLTNPEWNPRAHRYLFRMSLRKAAGYSPPKDRETRARQLLEKIWAFPLNDLNSAGSNRGIPTHALPMSPDFLDFVRLALGWQRISATDALRLHEIVEHIARE